MDIILQLTYNCNLRCGYCYQPKTENKVLDKEDAFIFIDDYFKYITKQPSKYFSVLVSADHEYVKESNLGIDFFGGECLLYPQLMLDIVGYIHECCIKYEVPEIWENFHAQVETNGTLIKDPKVQEFLELYKDKIRWAVTFEGTEENHDAKRRTVDGKGTFQTVKENVEYLTEYYGENCLKDKVTFDKDTVDLLPSVVKGLVKMGYRKALIGYDVTQFIDLEESERYYKAWCKAIDWIIENNIRFYPASIGNRYIGDISFSLCGSTGFQYCLSPGGIISACQMTNASYKNNDLAYGTIKDGITHPEILEKFRNRQELLYIPKQCKNCPIGHACEECPAANYVNTGDINKSVHNCGAMVAEARAQKYFLEKMLEHPEYPYYEKTKKHIQETNGYDPDYHYLVTDNYETEYVKADSSQVVEETNEEEIK